MYFEALASGGGDDWYNVILLTATNGITVTVSDGDEEIEIVGTGLQQAVTIHDENATYTISANMNGLAKSAASITTDSTSGKLFIRELKMAAIEVTFDDDFRGLDYTISDGTTTSTTQTFPATGNTVDIFVPNTGVWKVSSTIGSDTFESQGANVTSLDSSYTDDIHVIPDGKTVTPVNDIQLWLACANIKNKPYTKLEEVLADENTLRRLLTDDNAIDYLKRSTDWKSSKNLIPIMTSINTPSGLCFASSLYSDSQNQIYYAFNDYEQDEVGGGNDKRWFPSSYSGDQYLGYIFDNPVLFKYIRLRHSSYNITGIKFKIQGSNNTTTGADGTWTDLTSEIDFDYSQPGGTTGYINQIVDVSSNSTAYKAYRILYTTNIYNNGGSGYVCQTVKFFTIIGEGITDSELAMSYIGAYDYAADTLLSDADWTESICNSEYKKSILNVKVPIMTGITTPSGEVFSIGEYNSNTPAWHAFDGNHSDGWLSNTLPATDASYIGYDFGKSVKIVSASINNYGYDGNSVRIKNLKVQGSNNKTSGYVDLHTDQYPNVVDQVETYNFNNDSDYQYYRFLISDAWSGAVYVGARDIQFEGHEAGGVQSWLKAAGISKPYTTLDEVIADSDTLATLVTNHAAVDYLVTAKGLIEGITSSAKAMRYIGYRNYCADTLLADSEWTKGIVGSDYYESVVKNLVPEMTSANTPSGKVTASASGYTDCEPYKAFNNYQYGWYLTNAGFVNQWIEYEFDTPTIINGIKAWDCSDSNSEGYSVVTLKGSNVDNDWDNADTLISDYILKNHPSTANRIKQEGFANNTAYKYYRLMCTSNTLTGQNSYGYKIRLYGREDVDETILDIYSAASDSNIHLMQGGSPVNVGSTDTTGHGTISRSVLPNGEYELYSSVAKDPDDLSNDYHKTVKITDDTIEINLMPENAFYWYGYGDSNLEDVTTANGWSQYASGYPLSAPTHNTQNINLNAGSNVVGVALKDAKSDIDRLNYLIDPTFTGSNADSKYMLEIFGNKSYSNQDYHIIKPSDGTSGHEILKNTYNGDRIPWIAGLLISNAKLYGMWNTKHNPLANFFSAAKDTVYYTQGGVDIVVAKTNELGEAVVDLSSIPSGVTLKSSVAKDPDNLSNDYTKIFTMPLTEKFYMMPEDGDKMLYWYGWISDECEVISAGNGWTPSSGSYSFVNPTFNNNSIIGSSANNQQSGVGIKRPISNARTINALVKGINQTSNLYGFMTTSLSKTLTWDNEQDCVSTSLEKLSADVTALSNFYFAVFSSLARSFDISAIWYED